MPNGPTSSWRGPRSRGSTSRASCATSASRSHAGTGRGGSPPATDPPVVRREIALAAALVAILAIPAMGYLAYERQVHTRMRAVVAQATTGLELRPSGGEWQPASPG